MHCLPCRPACSCLPAVLAVHPSRRVKRRWALLASNPPRDNPADGAPRLHHPQAPCPRWWSGGPLSSPPWTPELCLQNAPLPLPRHHPSPQALASTRSRQTTLVDRRRRLVVQRLVRPLLV